MTDPFKTKTEPKDQLAKTEDPIKEEGEQPEARSKQKKKKDSVYPAGQALRGFHPQTMKLDLKNSKWWKTGFDNDYLEQ